MVVMRLFFSAASISLRLLRRIFPVFWVDAPLCAVPSVLLERTADVPAAVAALDALL
jgi:hypothetical protein